MTRFVKNINGTAGNKCRCGSWLRHWEKYSGEIAGPCAEVTCGKIAVDGAHVQKSGNHDQSWYIIPLCRVHNAMLGKEIEVMSYIPLVSANKAKTCEFDF